MLAVPRSMPIFMVCCAVPAACLRAGRGGRNGVPRGARSIPARIATTRWPGAGPRAATIGRMPEGDTLFRIAAGLRRALVGETVVEARARPGPLLRHVPDLSGLAGLCVRAVESRGKHLLITFGEGDQRRTLRTHLRMSGSWRLYRQ